MSLFKALACAVVAGLATKLITSTKDERRQIQENIDNFFDWVGEGIESAAESVKAAYEKL